MTDLFRPLLKWPGGKSREWSEIAPLLPPRVRHFVDPFMGGLAPFARTAFEGHAWLNDRHARLVDLHVRVQRQDRDLFAALDALGRDWERLGRVAKALAPTFARLVDDARARRQGDVAAAAKAVLRALRRESMDRVVPFALESLADKAKRLAALERKHEMQFAPKELRAHGETALRAGYYTLVRQAERAARGAVATADFLFVREYCYGSMFRRNAAGEFNIPYGGTTYNGKSFLARVEQLRSDTVVQALVRATFSCSDFEEFLAARACDLGPQDFVFVDPPYDSDFSTYGDHAFSAQDHERLAAALGRLATPWLLVIKDTPQVRRIYGSSRALGSFGKKYGYNVRGRNERSVRHLLLGNQDAGGGR